MMKIIRMACISISIIIIYCSILNAQDYRSVGLTASYENFGKSQDLSELMSRKYVLAKTNAQSQELLSSKINELFNKSFIGGSNVLSLSDNGRFRAVKEIAGSINSKSESLLVTSTIFDKNGNLLWRGKTSNGLILANNGQTMVTYDKSYGNTIEFYDLSTKKLSSEVSLNLKWGKFTDDSNYFICSDSKNIYQFSVDGNLLSKFKARSDIHKMSMSANGKYIIAGTKLSQATIDANDISESSIKPPFTLIDNYDKDSKQVKLPAETAEAKSLNPLKDPSTFTIIEDYHQIQHVSIDLASINHMSHIIDEKYIAFARHNKAIVYDIGKKLVVKEFVIPDDYFDISDIDLNRDYLTVFAMKYRPTGGVEYCTLYQIEIESNSKVQYRIPYTDIGPHAYISQVDRSNIFIYLDQITLNLYNLQ